MLDVYYDMIGGKFDQVNFSLHVASERSDKISLQAKIEIELINMAQHEFAPMQQRSNRLCRVYKLRYTERSGVCRICGLVHA